MTNMFKFVAASALAISLTACAATDDRYQVGVDDNDRYAANEMAQDQNESLSDEQTFGFDDDDQYETRTVGTTTMDAQDRTAVASRVIRTETTILDARPQLTNYSQLYGALETAGLATTFDGETDYTVFAPDNEAFSMVDTSGLTNAQLKSVLTGHVVEGRISSSDLQMKLDQYDGSYSVETLSGETIRFYEADNQIKVADANGYTYTVEAADNEFANGYIHGIDGVLFAR